jgi:hypothetical protein
VGEQLQRTFLRAGFAVTFSAKPSDQKPGLYNASDVLVTDSRAAGVIAANLLLLPGPPKQLQWHELAMAQVRAAATIAGCAPTIVETLGHIERVSGVPTARLAPGLQQHVDRFDRLRPNPFARMH